MKTLIDTPISFLPAHAKAQISQSLFSFCASGGTNKQKYDWKDISDFR